jgi:hypothetical protein
VDLFTVICRRQHATFKVFIAAETPEEAAAEARKRGHDVDQVMKAGVWTRPGEAGRQPAACTRCGYDLDGLTAERGWCVCPECGLRQMRGER